MYVVECDRRSAARCRWRGMISGGKKPLIETASLEGEAPVLDADGRAALEALSQSERLISEDILNQQVPALLPNALVFRIMCAGQ